MPGVASSPGFELHTRLHRMPPVVAGTKRDYYLPGRWVPHCTIAEGLEPDDICVTVELARSSGVFREVSIQGIGLVQLGPYRVIAVFPVSPENPAPTSTRQIDQKLPIHSVGRPGTGGQPDVSIRVSMRPGTGGPSGPPAYFTLPGADERNTMDVLRRLGVSVS